MQEPNSTALPSPRFEAGRTFWIAGLDGRFTLETNGGIPGLWDAFGPSIGEVPGQVGGMTYGLCCNPRDDGSFEYVAGVEVSSPDGLPPSFRCIKVEPQRYAVFVHAGDVSTLHETFHRIWHQWLPASGFQAGHAPEFERYSADFDPVAGTGTVEIWLPVRGGADAAAA
ncbi:GyrI-like domain-containing protein [Cupriavidus basilensis]|uniref:GyrI-like domain-containing protein n=1 Tax=Cupriavidus basilensis TaxID=68895 RepID=UPI0028417777|nr:GyrI-like domain-containing protein [Cupriavidus basilensis]MDR3379848.1 GyrI-like domain-containing protein [Cupriavidus basilensis]